MKKFIIFLLIVAVIGVIVYFALNGGFGSGEGNGSKSNQEQAEDNNTKSGQDKDANNGANVLKISVSGNEYVYENERVSLDDFMAEVSKAGETVSVEVKNDNASLNAYNDLLNKLKDANISFSEQ